MSPPRPGPDDRGDDRDVDARFADIVAHYGPAPAQPLPDDVAEAPERAQPDRERPLPAEEDDGGLPDAVNPPPVWRDWVDPEVEDHFVPPEPPPLPAGDLHFWGILVGLLGGPFILVLAHVFQLLEGSIWNWLGIGLSVAGFWLLVLRLPTTRDDDPTGGARV